jgi:hypothetical protein
MALTPGLSPSIRLVQPDPEFEGMGEDSTVEIIEGDDKEIANEDGKVLEIEHDDGSITISLDGKSLTGEDEAKGPTGWFDNLVDDIPELELNRISDELLRGISDDIDSRKDWIEDHSTGIKLLGLKIEIPGLGGSAEGAPVEGMNRVRHPLLLEAVLRFQANARSEMLPTDGPVKIRNDDNNATLQEDQLAKAFERDLNHYLTSTATEYYPDTDRMLFMLGFGGTAFKKVYFCPLRNRPVSETVDADDLIVNNNATDLQNAKRITHRSYQRPSTVKRLQILGVYRDIDLSTPNMSNLDSFQREKLSVQGIAPDSMNPNDRDREIYECNCELNIQGYEHKMRGKETGLEIPYRVTVDVSSKKVLSVVRNYNEDKQELPEARKTFVKYTYVPGMGFYDIGLLHILGNTTNAITAAWRELLDAGMYANFPGFLMADTGARQNTNIFRVPPGGGALVKTGGMPINQAIMPLPYKEPSGTLMGLVDNMAQTGMRLGGTSEAAVGEGRQDAPVGTTLAQIEQSQKVLNSVHKRMHAAQAEEFQLLKEVFKEHPDSFWQRNNKPAAPWDEKTFLTALENYELIPQADPNTASQVQRLMKVMALKQLQQANPSLYDPIAIDTAALQAIGWSNPSQFLAPPSAQQNPPPELVKMQADAKAAQTMSDAHMLSAQSKAKSDEAKTQIDAQKVQIDAAKVEIDKMKAEAAMKDSEIEAQDKYQDRKFKEHVQLIDLAQNIAVHPESLDVIQPLIAPAIQDLSDISGPEEQQPGLSPGLIPRDQ